MPYDGPIGKKGQWEARNWKSIDPETLKKMHPLLRSKYMAYEEIPRNVQDAQDIVKKRLRDYSKASQPSTSSLVDDEESEEMNKREKLIGQLKAAEARNRIRIMRLRFEANKDQEINHLISCQSSASKAVRLQALLPLREKKKKQTYYDKLQEEKSLQIENIDKPMDVRVVEEDESDNLYDESPSDHQPTEGIFYEVGRAFRAQMLKEARAEANQAQALNIPHPGTDRTQSLVPPPLKRHSHEVEEKRRRVSDDT